MEGADILRRLLQNRTQVPVQSGQSLAQPVGGNLQGVRLRAVELFGIPAESGVAVLPYVRQNSRDCTGYVPLVLRAG